MGIKRKSSLQTPKEMIFQFEYPITPKMFIEAIVTSNMDLNAIETSLQNPDSLFQITCSGP